MNSGTTALDILKSRPPGFYHVSPDITVYEAVRVMGVHNIGSVLVMQQNKLVGILTERDYARKVVLQGRTSAETLVKEIMTPYPGMITITAQTRLEECMAIMTDRKVRHLPILDGEQVLGIISIGDVVSLIINSQRETIEHLRQYLYQ
jgi:CBS domain-containing protein